MGKPSQAVEAVPIASPAAVEPSLGSDRLFYLQTLAVAECVRGYSVGASET